jgi:hypothetical protein
LIGKRLHAHHEKQLRTSQSSEPDSEPGYPGPDEARMKRLGLYSNSVAKQVVGTALKVGANFTPGNPACQAPNRDNNIAFLLLFRDQGIAG